MKKLVIIDLTPFWGGGEVYSYTIMKQLREEGWQVVSISCHERHKEVSDEHILTDGSFRDFKRLRSIVRQYANQKYIIHFNGLKSIYLSFICRKRSRYIGSKHLPYATPEVEKWKYRLSILLSKVLYKKLDHLICINGLIMSELPKSVQQRSSYIMNGVPDKEVILTHDYDPVKICFVGRLAEQKGLRRLLPAFLKLQSQHPQVHLTIAGKGNLQTFVEDFIRENQLEAKITFLGFVKDTSKIFEASHICALPSVHEGFPLSLLEAMRSGCALLAHNIPGVRDIVHEGTNGLLVDVSDQTVYEGLRHMVQDAEKLRAFRISSRKLYLEKYTSEIMVGKTRDIYEGR